MQETLHVSTVPLSATRSREKLKDFLFAVAAIGAAVVVFGCIFNRATVLSYSIGYNLYGAERVLDGEIPYKDFHTLYPPATLYVNALLFQWVGISLCSAMFGVFVFKVLTILMLYLSGRQIMPRTWAIAAALISLFWLRPNGAFKAVPMQYGALFLAIGLFLLLKYESRPKTIYVFFAGVAFGILTLFKHNIGMYALAGYLFFVALERGPLKHERGANGDGLRRALIMASGLAAVIMPTIVYMSAQGALGPMARTLLLGPGEFLATRMVLPRSPVVPALFALALSAAAYAAYLFRGRKVVSAGIWMVVIVLTSAFTLGADEPAMNKLIFYIPVIVFAAALLGVAFNKRVAAQKRRVVFLTFAFAAAALIELFPRFAREQSIGAMPFVILFSIYLIYVCRPFIGTFAGGELQSKFAMAILPLMFLLIGGRLLFSAYFDDGFRFKSTVELKADRGRGVYFPEEVAKKTDEIISYIQERVPAEHYIFAQANGGSPYLFLASRKNPSSAQFWGGVGVTAVERAATLEEIERKQVNLIITSDEAIEAEHYEPLRDYINQNFKRVMRFDEVVILER